MLLCIVSVFVTVAMDSVHTYHVALVGLFSAGLVFTTSSVNSLIYYSDAAKEAAAAGFILLSMVSVRKVFALVSSSRQLTRLADGLDLLLRLTTHCFPSPHPRFLRSAQGRSTITQQPLHVPAPTATRHDPLKQPPTPDVQRKPTCRIRNIVSRDRIRRRRSRSTKQSFSVSIPSTSFYTWRFSARHRHRRKPATNRVRLPLSREGHLQLRGEP